MADDPKQFRGSEFIGYAPRSGAAHRSQSSDHFVEGESALLGVAALCVALTTADIFFALVSLPAVQSGLGSSYQALQLAVALHSAAFASVLIAAGRLGDYIGAHRVCKIGLGLMALSSAAAALSPSTGFFIASRGLQGVAVGFVTPQVIALIGTRFEGNKRRKAFAAFALSQALGAVVGQLVAGAIIEADILGLGWRVSFAVLSVGAIISFLLLASFVSDARDPFKRPLDVTGAALSALTLGLITWSLTVGRTADAAVDWRHGVLGATLLCLIMAIHQFRLFRAGGHPMLPLQLFGNARVRLGLLATFVFYMGVLSFYWLVGIHSQRDLKLGPWAAGCLFAMCGIGFSISTALGPRINARTQRRALYWGAIGLAGAHLLGLLTSLLDRGLFGTAAYLLFAGASIGLIMAPLLATVTSEARSEDAGALAGVFGTVQAAGNGLGASILPIAYLSPGIKSFTSLPLGGYATSLLLLFFSSMLLAWMIKRLLKTRPGHPSTY